MRTPYGLIADNTLMPSAADAVMSREWFYRFHLPDGRVSPCYVGDDVIGIHDTRLAMVDWVLEPLFGADWSAASCLDMACHEGFFCSHLAAKGCRDVLGIDVRPEHVRDAELIKEAFGFNNLRLECRDVLDLEPAELGKFDIVLVLGLLYHLENPIGALRRAFSHTRSVCIVETQVAPNLSGVIDWGSYRYHKAMVGSFALVDESSELAGGNAEASVLNVSLVPSIEALVFVMKALGFSRVEVIEPPEEAYEQLRFKKRVVVAGYIDDAPAG